MICFYIGDRPFTIPDPTGSDKPADSTEQSHYSWKDHLLRLKAVALVEIAATGTVAIVD
jgi:hypothetical protein